MIIDRCQYKYSEFCILILFLFYTATTQIDGVVRQTQCIATSKDGVNFEKYEGNPVIKEPPQGFSNDFRDPKVFEHNGR